MFVCLNSINYHRQDYNIVNSEHLELFKVDNIGLATKLFTCQHILSVC